MRWKRQFHLEDEKFILHLEFPGQVKTICNHKSSTALFQERKAIQVSIGQNPILSDLLALDNIASSKI